LPRLQLVTPDDGHRRCPETCRVSWQNKLLDTWCILLVIYTKIITMDGHLNIKLRTRVLPFQELHISPRFNTYLLIYKCVAFLILYNLPCHYLHYCSSPHIGLFAFMHVI
jgi:hypothetical protein